METTRHFTATVYVVNDGATALHEHARLGIRIPPGGHVDRDELPHEAGLREVREETGLEATLVHERYEVGAPDGRVLPRPAHVMLYDIDVRPDGTAAHQHIDHVYYAGVGSREIDPGPGEEGADAWEWYTTEELRTSGLDEDTATIGTAAIETVDGSA
ncbi:MAG: NUDIX domain-containing protein [Halalkalicoccus sp.]